jgi:chromosome segregation ATPase
MNLEFDLKELDAELLQLIKSKASPEERNKVLEKTNRVRVRLMELESGIDEAEDAKLIAQQLSELDLVLKDTIETRAALSARLDDIKNKARANNSQEGQVQKQRDMLDDAESEQDRLRDRMKRARANLQQDNPHVDMSNW